MYVHIFALDIQIKKAKNTSYRFTDIGQSNLNKAFKPQPYKYNSQCWYYYISITTVLLILATDKPSNNLHYTAPACPTTSGQPVESSGQFPFKNSNNKTWIT